MGRLRIQGYHEKIINSFVERNYYASQTDVITAALKLLLDHHMKLDAEWLNKESDFDDETYLQQMEVVKYQKRKIP